MHKVMSAEQIAANRRNARLSTGPRTRDGKARAARNNTRHGLFSRSLFLTAGPDPENPADFLALRAALYADFNLVSSANHYRDCQGAVLAYGNTPSDLNHAMQYVLVDRLARLHWLARRVTRFEALAAAAYATPCPSTADSKSTDADLAYFDHPSFLAFVRFQSRIDRALHQTLQRIAPEGRRLVAGGASPRIAERTFQAPSGRQKVVSGTSHAPMPPIFRPSQSSESRLSAPGPCTPVCLFPAGAGLRANKKITLRTHLQPQLQLPMRGLDDVPTPML
jgi:hypothetical protein